jgi:type IV pilus assembly protein PilO
VIRPWQRQALALMQPPGLQTLAGGPAWRRHLSSLAVGALAFGALYLLALPGVRDELQVEQAREAALKASFLKKLVPAHQLEALTLQRQELGAALDELEPQLSDGDAGDALLLKLHDMALGHQMLIEQFKPGAAVVRPDYIELPLAIRVKARYGQLLAFATELARLQPVVTVSRLQIMAGPEDLHTVDMLLLRYRRLNVSPGLVRPLPALPRPQAAPTAALAP